MAEFRRLRCRMTRNAEASGVRFESRFAWAYFPPLDGDGAGAVAEIRNPIP